MRRLVSVALPLAFLSLSAIPILAQERSAEMDALGWMVGEWTATTDGFSGKQVCKWLGNSFLQCESSYPTNSSLWVMGYDAEQGEYTATYFFGNGGSGAFDTVTLKDDYVTWLIDIPTGGQWRGTWVLESQDVLTYKAEMAEESGEWVVQNEMKMTRVR